MTDFEKVNVPLGAYMAWGFEAGQSVVGKPLEYSEDGGEDFNSEPCPQLQIELTEPTFAVNKIGKRTDFNAGLVIVVNAGLVSLRRAFVATNRKYGIESLAMMKIELTGTVKHGTNIVKQFEIQVVPGDGSKAARRAVEDAIAPPVGYTQAEWDALAPETKAALKNLQKLG